MNILHVSCSPRGAAAESYQLAQKIIGHLRRAAPEAAVVTREAGALPHVDADYALAQQSSADMSRTGSMALSEVLIRELARADCVVIGTPMHNLTVSSALKAWLDHVIRVRRTFNISREGRIGLLRDRPVFVAVAAGGTYSGAQARQPDFLTPYLKAALAITGLRDLAFFSVEGLGLGPAAVAAARARADAALDTYFSGNGSIP